MDGQPLTPGTQRLVDESLRPYPSSVSKARGLVRELLTDSGRTDLLEDAELLVSEIVTNALIHAGTAIGFHGRVDGRGLRIEVHDGSPHHPALRNYAETAGTGRGLTLMVELADDWGVVPDASGKTVWFDLGGQGRRERGARGAGPAESSGPVRPGHPGTGTTVPVQFLRMPLLLHEAWREHAETLLREYLLASLDVDGVTPAGVGDAAVGIDPIQVHADAADAMALLEEQVPAADIDLDADRLMTAATEPRVTAPRVLVKVPQSSVPNFATLDEVLDRAFELVEAGQVLAPRTQPEIQAFRRWVCSQVEMQAAGQRPVPWVMVRDIRAPERGRTAPDQVDVTAATEAIVVADATNEIAAVSAAAVELLGYETADELVGQRLVVIIPPRFQQAHIAGFTLHTLVGRAPLLDRDVVVPALRRDGEEVSVRLKVTAHATEDGSRVYVATMSPVTW